MHYVTHPKTKKYLTPTKSHPPLKKKILKTIFMRYRRQSVQKTVYKTDTNPPYSITIIYTAARSRTTTHRISSTSSCFLGPVCVWLKLHSPVKYLVIQCQLCMYVLMLLMHLFSVMLLIQVSLQNLTAEIIPNGMKQSKYIATHYLLQLYKLGSSSWPPNCIWIVPTAPLPPCEKKYDW